MPISNGKYVAPTWANNAPPNRCIRVKCNLSNPGK